MRLPPDYDDEETFFINSIYTIQENLIFHLEQVCLMLYMINFDQQKSLFQETKDWFLDYYFVNKCIKYMLQNKTVCMNVMRFYQHNSIDGLAIVGRYGNNGERIRNYFDEIERNNCTVYKNMPFSLVFIMGDCKECKEYYQYWQSSLAYKNKQQQNDLQQYPEKKEEINQQFQAFRQQLLDQKSKQQTHTRTIEIQINVLQNIFQNSYQYNERILVVVFQYLRNLQNLYVRFFEQLEGIFNPTKDKNLKIFDIGEKQIQGSVLYRQPHSVPLIVMRYTNMEKLEMVFKNIKIFTCQIQKLLRYIYYMNLIGRDPNDLSTLQENKPTIITEPTNEQRQQNIALSIKRQGLDFDLVLKFKFDPKSHNLLYYISNLLNDNQNLNEEKEKEYREILMMVFRSINNPDSETLTLENQIRHITNYYNIIQQYFQNPQDKDQQLHQQIILIVKFLDQYKLIIDFSKKDKDIPNLQDKQQIQNPRYIFEITSQYDVQKYSPLKLKAYIGRCSENKLFLLLQNNNQVEVKYIQIQEIQQYIIDFIMKYIY